MDGVSRITPLSPLPPLSLPSLLLPCPRSRLLSSEHRRRDTINPLGCASLSQIIADAEELYPDFDKDALAYFRRCLDYTVPGGQYRLPTHVRAEPRRNGSRHCFLCADLLPPTLGRDRAGKERGGTRLSLRSRDHVCAQPPASPSRPCLCSARVARGRLMSAPLTARLSPLALRRQDEPWAQRADDLPPPAGRPPALGGGGRRGPHPRLDH